MRHRSSTAPAGETVTLTGRVEDIRTLKRSTGFTALQVRVRGERSSVTVKGTLSGMLQVGDWASAVGQWANSERGPEFKARLMFPAPPDTLEDLERYLASGEIEGVGPVLARRLAKQFGDGLFRILDRPQDEAVARLIEVRGIGRRTALLIHEAWRLTAATRNAFLFLLGLDLSDKLARTIRDRWGELTEQVIRENPYRLIGLGLGFHRADRIAVQLGIPADSPHRQRAGVRLAMREITGMGHVGLPRPEFVERAAAILRERAGREVEARAEPIGAAIDAEIAVGVFVEADLEPGLRAVLDAGLAEGEERIARRLRELSHGPLPWGWIDLDAGIDEARDRTGLTLGPEQEEAVRRALTTKVLVVTGGPGVGKTTVLDSLLGVLGARRMSLALCAPTGKAAKRMKESTGLPASTIHRLLGYDPETDGFKHNRSFPLDCDVLVVDESSMVDIERMAALLDAVPNYASLLIVGDVDQLPSVGPGRVLRDIIDSGAVPVARLTEIRRQAAGSRIITNARAINEGRMPDLSPGDDQVSMHFARTASPGETVEKILGLVADRIPKGARLKFGRRADPIRDIQVLVPMKMGPAGKWALNDALQARLNPRAAGRPKSQIFAVGDKVMQTKNDYAKGVINGDVGFVLEAEAGGRVVVEFDEDRMVTYEREDYDRDGPLELAYAATIHKSQGSEYPVVVIPVLKGYRRMLQRNLLYTGVTRGKELVILVGEEGAIRTAVETTTNQERRTRLGQLLSEERRMSSAAV